MSQEITCFLYQQSSRFAVPIVVIAALVASGCGSGRDTNQLPVFPAKGTISLKGELPKGACLVLHPKGNTAKAPNGDVIRPRATVGQDGTFAFSSYNSNDGAPVGEYVITIEWQKIVPGPNGDPTKGPSLVPPPFRRPETSPLIVKIAEGPNQLQPIVLK